ncbi:MAG: chemotaxis response regulator protein-glutamate methylesterase [Myxococcota bacterium]
MSQNPSTPRPSSTTLARPGRKVRVLVVDDSAVIRNLLVRNLGNDPDIEVVGTASDPYLARDAILALTPDVMTLDVEMPRMDGVTFLKKLMPQHPLPVVMVSTLTVAGGEKTLEALASGAVDFIGKPLKADPAALAALVTELRAKVKAAALVDVKRFMRSASAPRPTGIAAPLRAVDNRSGTRVIAIGSSTGGVEALSEVIPRLPPGTPPVLIVQHMPKEFVSILARRLGERSQLRVREAIDGEMLAPGTVYVGPGGRHLTLTGSGDQLRVRLDDSPAVAGGHRPAVDNLFRSVAERCGARAIGVILTGMGKDGAEGLLAMRKAGARTIAQDAASCVVFGMPREAIALDAAQQVKPLGQMADTIVRLVGGEK